jgi:hypothetical protein
MQIVEIVVHAGRTFNHPYEDYSNLRPSVSMKATLGPEDNPEKVIQELQARAEALVEDHKRNMLRSLEELYHLGRAQQELISLENQLKNAQERIQELREKDPRLTIEDKTE